MKVFKWSLYLLCTLIFVACRTTTNAPNNTGQPATYATKSNVPSKAKRPKNIVLLIGDGMGLAQITAGMYANKNSISLERFKVVGLQKTHCYDELITDSAASATAIACGVKTYNEAIGMGFDTLPRISILELAEGRGMATGLVATSTITHATPASFIAHNKSRVDEFGIALDFLKTDIDFFLGGGLKYFQNRTDSKNLCEALRQKGYYVSDYSREPLEMMVLPNQPVAYFTANDRPLPASQGRDYLPQAADMALQFLGNRSQKGFFLMVEGSQIDWGGHANDAAYIINEMLDFNNTIEAVLEWAIRDGNTLVIVTADHETGGFALDQDFKIPAGQQPSIPINQTYRTESASRDSLFSTLWHTASMVPVFAYGPGAEQFAGIYENTAIFDKMKYLLGL